MDDIQLEAIRRSRVYLVHKLILDSLWDYLLQKDIFSEEMIASIQCERTPSDRKRKLITDLMRRRREAYEDFLVCLELSQHKHCADEIRRNELLVRRERGCLQGVPDETPHHMDPETTPQVTSQVMSHPIQASSDTQGMNDVPMQDSCRPTTVISQPTSDTSGSAQGQDNMSAYSIHRRHSIRNVYEMESTPRGLMYLINNHEFQYLEKRDGTDVDCTNLQLLFSNLGYRVSTDTDLTAKEMEIRLKEFSKFEDNKSVDSLVVVILSHGDHDDKVYGVDGEATDQGFRNYITTKHLKSWFGNRLCPELSRKPKLFIIQACRGSCEDIVSPTSSSSSSVSRDAIVNTLDTPDSLEENALPDQSDMLFAHSSVPGYVSYRDPQEGSVFISTLARVFREESHREHLADMLTMVNDRIVNEFHTPEGLKYLTSPVNQLTKKWFFNPDL